MLGDAARQRALADLPGTHQHHHREREQEVVELIEVGGARNHATDATVKKTHAYAPFSCLLKTR